MPLSSLSLPGSKGSFQKAKSFQLAVDVDINTRKLRYPGALWHGEKRLSVKGCQAWIDMLVDSVMLEVAVGLIISADLILTIMTFTMSEETAESTPVFVIGAIFLIVLLGDVILRVTKYRLTFFHKPLNWLEFIVALAGCVMLVFEGVERSGCGGPCSNNRSAAGGGTSLGRGIRPTIKAWRIVRTMMQLANSRGGLHKQIDRQTDRFTSRLIRLYLNDFFLIPNQNVYMKLTQGQMHVEKAQVRSSVLKGLHLPLTISCGIIDLLHVKVTMNGKEDDSNGGEESNHKMLVVLENALIVVGPGHHQEEPAPPWDFETVLESKRKLIDLLTRRLEAGARHKVAAAAAQGSTRMRKMSLVSKKLKQRAVSHMEEVLSRGVHISIANLEIRYEDGFGQLTNGAGVVGGLRIGVLTLRAAGAAEGDELEQEKDFRVRGKWRHDGVEERPSTSASMVWVDDPSDSTKSSGKKLGKLGKQSKRKLSQGVRMALQADRICAFWDLRHSSEAGTDVRKSVAGRYSDVLQEGSGIDINTFLAEHALTRRRERFRLALCKEVESRMFHSVGRCVAREFARRLRDRVAAHKYIVMPFGCSLHAMVRPPNEGSGRGRTLPHVDMSMEMSTISLTPDMAQAASLAWLADYLKRWLQEDKRFQWKPPTISLGHERTSVAYARWTYALHRILCSIDPGHCWHSLSWIGMQRRCTYRAAYLAALTSTAAPDQENIAVLQVALPLPDALSLRKEAALCVAFRQLTKRNALENALRDFLRAGPKAAPDPASRNTSGGLSRNASSADSADVDLEAGSSSPGSPGSPTGKEDGGAKHKFNFKLSELSTQVHVTVGTVQMGILTRELQEYAARRPIVLGQATGITVSAVCGAPRLVWLRLAPPEASAAMAEEVCPRGVVFELNVNSVRAVFFAAPSAAWQLRRVFFCGGGALGPRGGRPDDDRQLQAGAEGAGVGGAGARQASSKQFAKGARGSNLERALLEAGIRIRAADVGFVEACTSWHQVPKRHWVFAMCLPPVEVHVLRPLVQALVRTVKPPKPPPAVAAAAAAARATADALGKTPRSARSTKTSVGSGRSGNFTTGGSSPSKPGLIHVPSAASLNTMLRAQAKDSAMFWADLLELSRQRADRAAFERKHRLNEKLTGTSGFLKGGLVNGSILFLGGLRADVLDACTKDRWLMKAVHLPAGTATVSRGGLPPEFKVGFRPLGSVPDACLAQAEDGWWFETKAQAKAMAELLNPDKAEEMYVSEKCGGHTFTAPPAESYGDTSCAGADALERPGEEFAPLKEGCDNPVGASAWQRATVRALNYKPRDSEKGLLPTSCRLSPRRPLINTSATSLPFCCQDMNLACMKSLAGKKYSSVLPSERIRMSAPVLPAVAPSVLVPMAPAKGEQHGRRQGAPKWRSWSPPPEGPSGDLPFQGVDVWLETLSPETVGLPKPEKAEELWAGLGCARLPSASTVYF